MSQGHPIEGPRPRVGAVNPWIEVSAWILAFVILLAAQCAPEHTQQDGGRSQSVVAGAR